MPISDAKKRNDAKYTKATFDDVRIRVAKGRREVIKAHAKKYQPSTGEVGTAGYTPQGSLNSFVNRAIDETIKRDIMRGAKNDESS